MNEELFGNEVSTIENPFNQECIESISINAFHGPFTRKMIFIGKVEFKNNNTEGSQRFKGSNLADVYNQIKEFVMKL